MRILAFSDLHGHTPTLERLRDDIEGKSFDYMLVAGDLTNADLISPSSRVYQVKEIFSIMESFKIPYYFVWGVPFREGSLARAMQMAENAGHASTGEIKRFLSSLKFGKYLRRDRPVKLREYLLTADLESISDNTILLNHHHREIISRALIQLDGHIHFGQHVSNYLNLGFLYRDAAHRAQPMVGCYWELTLENQKVSVNFVNLGSQLKEYKCNIHSKEGTFYIPYYWKKCPVCFDPENAINRSV